MAKEYEMALVLHPELDEEHQQGVLARYRQVIEKHGGNVEEPNAWGKRRLAYEIKDLNEGFYFFVPYTADATANAELDRLLRIDENVLRYLVVVRPRPNPPKPTSMPETGAHGDGPRSGPTPAGDRPGPGLPEPRKRPVGVDSTPTPAPSAPTPARASEEAPAPSAPTPAPASEEAPATPAEPAAAPAEAPTEAPAADAEPTQE